MYKVSCPQSHLVWGRIANLHVGSEVTEAVVLEVAYCSSVRRGLVTGVAPS